MADNLIEAFLETSNEARFQVIEQVRQQLTSLHDQAYEGRRLAKPDRMEYNYWDGRVDLTNYLLDYLRTLETPTQPAVPDDVPNNPTTHNPT